MKKIFLGKQWCILLYFGGVYSHYLLQYTGLCVMIRGDVDAEGICDDFGTGKR